MIGPSDPSLLFLRQLRMLRSGCSKAAVKRTPQQPHDHVHLRYLIFIHPRDCGAPCTETCFKPLASNYIHDAIYVEHHPSLLLPF